MQPSVRVRVVAAGAGLLGTITGATAAPMFDPLGRPAGEAPSLTRVHLLGVSPDLITARTTYGAWRVNDAPSGMLSNIGMDAGRVLSDAGGFYAIAALNSDGGVSIMLPGGAVFTGAMWSDLFATDIATVKGWLATSDLASLETWFADEVYDAGLATPFGRRTMLVAFDAPDPVVIEVVDVAAAPAHAIARVPAPGMVGLLGIGGAAAIGRRRR